MISAIPRVFPGYRELHLRIIFVYNCELMCEQMPSIYSKMGLICYSAMNIEEAWRQVKKYDIELMVIDVIHFYPRHIMDFRNHREDMWITAITGNVMDDAYYQAQEFGATWVTNPEYFRKSFPIMLQAASCYDEYLSLKYGKPKNVKTFSDDPDRY